MFHAQPEMFFSPISSVNFVPVTLGPAPVLYPLRNAEYKIIFFLWVLFAPLLHNLFHSSYLRSSLSSLLESKLLRAGNICFIHYTAQYPILQTEALQKNNSDT